MCWFNWFRLPSPGPSTWIFRKRWRWKESRRTASRRRAPSWPARRRTRTMRVSASAPKSAWEPGCWKSAPVAKVTIDWPRRVSLNHASVPLSSAALCPAPTNTQHFTWFSLVPLMSNIHTEPQEVPYYERVTSLFFSFFTFVPVSCVKWNGKSPSFIIHLETSPLWCHKGRWWQQPRCSLLWLNVLIPFLTCWRSNKAWVVAGSSNLAFQVEAVSHRLNL